MRHAVVALLVVAALASSADAQFQRGGRFGRGLGGIENTNYDGDFMFCRIWFRNASDGDGAGWSVDWPAKDTSPTPNMGFGQYCTNCHASAKDNQTFAALKNIKGEPGDPLVFLSQNFFLNPPWQSQLAGSVAAHVTALMRG